MTQPDPAPPPPSAAPTPTPRKIPKLWLLAVIGGGVLACALFACVAVLVDQGAPKGDSAAPTAPGPAAEASPSTGQPASPASPATTAPPPNDMNTPVRDGMFEFTVTKVQCGVARVGSPDFGEAAQGQFCLVTLKITNIGNEARDYYSGNQYAYNSAGQRYDADTSAGYELPDGAGSIDAINPGITVTGMIVFDIPKGASLAALELHDSVFSGGVRVRLVAA